MGKLRIIDDVESFAGKRVVLRVDSDVDLDENLPAGRQVVDDTRLAAALPTLQNLLEKGGFVTIIGHLGRPVVATNDEERIKNKELSLKPIAEWFASKISGNAEPTKIDSFDGFKITDKVSLVENIRFFPEEEKNDPEFAKKLAALGDVFVNDAFAVCHREHASIVGIATLLPSYAGLHLQKEIEVLSKIITDPLRPLAVLIGGAKIETKLPMVEKMHKVADYVLVGGEIAAQDKVLIEVQHEKIEGKKSAVLVADLTSDGLDISPKSTENMNQVLGLAATIVWNGPVGMIRKKEERIMNNEDTERGTREIAEFIVSQSAYKVIGGGDTLSYLRELGLLDKFDFVSTGGGAMLEFLSGKELPGIAVLRE
ncbi:MAG TPA: phosphoglycerate kinase [Patescibacteria group bacterium]|nr:phosphoglycerate kinase [Patescibacteria group bacterium]